MKASSRSTSFPAEGGHYHTGTDTDTTTATLIQAQTTLLHNHAACLYAACLSLDEQATRREFQFDSAARATPLLNHAACLSLASHLNSWSNSLHILDSTARDHHYTTTHSRSLPEPHLNYWSNSLHILDSAARELGTTTTSLLTHAACLSLTRTIGPTLSTYGTAQLGSSGPPLHHYTTTQPT